MIKSFKELDEAYGSREICMSELIGTLDQEELEMLKNEIKTWGEETYKEAHMALDETGIKVPNYILEDICLKELELAHDIYSQEIYSTNSKKRLIEEILFEIGMQSWPCDSSDEEYTTKFYKDLREKAPKFGIELDNENP